jgi:hypothetical protein
VREREKERERERERERENIPLRRWWVWDREETEIKDVSKLTNDMLYFLATPLSQTNVTNLLLSPGEKREYQRPTNRTGVSDTQNKPSLEPHVLPTYPMKWTIKYSKLISNSRATTTG